MASRYRADWNRATTDEIIAGLRQWCGRVEAKQPALASLLAVTGVALQAQVERGDALARDVRSSTSLANRREMKETRGMTIEELIAYVESDPSGAEVLRLRSRIRAALGEAWPPRETPDARCITTPDGGCVGDGCMHDVKE